MKLVTANFRSDQIVVTYDHDLWPWVEF